MVMTPSGIFLVDLVYGLGSRVLGILARLLGISFAEMAVYLFAVAGPLAFAIAMGFALFYRGRWLALRRPHEGTPAKRPRTGKRETGALAPDELGLVRKLAAEIGRASEEPAPARRPSVLANDDAPARRPLAVNESVSMSPPAHGSQFGHGRAATDDGGARLELRPTLSDRV